MTHLVIQKSVTKVIFWVIKWSFVRLLSGSHQTVEVRPPSLSGCRRQAVEVRPLSSGRHGRQAVEVRPLLSGRHRRQAVVVKPSRSGRWRQAVVVRPPYCCDLKQSCIISRNFSWYFLSLAPSNVKDPLHYTRERKIKQKYYTAKKRKICVQWQ